MVFWGNRISDRCRVVHYKAIRDVPLGSYLNEAELDEFSGKDDHKRWGWLASRYAVKQAVVEQLREMQLTDVIIDHESSGRPVVRGLDHVMVSLSHSGWYGAAMIGVGKPVGIDIERVYEWPEATLQGFLTNREYRLVMAEEDDNRNDLATWFWVVKEAYLKALGCGLRQHPQRVEVLGEIGKSSIWDEQRRAAAMAWGFRKPGYLIAHVSTGQMMDTSYHEKAYGRYAHR